MFQFIDATHTVLHQHSSVEKAKLCHETTAQRCCHLLLWLSRLSSCQSYRSTVIIMLLVTKLAGVSHLKPSQEAIRVKVARVQH